MNTNTTRAEVRGSAQRLESQEHPEKVEGKHKGTGRKEKKKEEEIEGGIQKVQHLNNKFSRKKNTQKIAGKKYPRKTESCVPETPAREQAERAPGCPGCRG